MIFLTQFQALSQKPGTVRKHTNINQEKQRPTGNPDNGAINKDVKIIMLDMFKDIKNKIEVFGREKSNGNHKTENFSN